ncbi:unnamed protein product [Moneuplotes crassus]|uniref:Uncharacterized protein n=1 Tax=Euplotes crassus TaxID=5936 RepID=A0AAD2D542_EUPCR|nr:unnamed protein product [Moneuplotes crassus]
MFGFSAQVLARRPRLWTRKARFCSRNTNPEKKECKESIPSKTSESKQRRKIHPWLYATSLIFGIKTALAMGNFGQENQEFINSGPPEMKRNLETMQYYIGKANYQHLPQEQIEFLYKHSQSWIKQEDNIMKAGISPSVALFTLGVCTHAYYYRKSSLKTSLASKFSLFGVIGLNVYILYNYIAFWSVFVNFKNVNKDCEKLIQNAKSD